MFRAPADQRESSKQFPRFQIQVVSVSFQSDGQMEPESLPAVDEDGQMLMSEQNDELISFGFFCLEIAQS